MEDEWSDGKVMWGFVRVKDANSGLGKFVLINWVRPLVRLVVNSGGS